METKSVVPLKGSFWVDFAHCQECGYFLQLDLLVSVGGDTLSAGSSCSSTFLESGLIGKLSTMLTY